MAQPNWKFALANPWHFLALGFGSGLSPVAPGTMGSLAAIPLFFLIQPWLAGVGVWIFLAIAFALGVVACGRAGKALGVVDHGGIVWDEIVAVWLVLFTLPGEAWWWYGSGFAVFRFFDIVKPWPIRAIDEKTTGGLGVMLDDLLAAGYTVAVLYAVAEIAAAWGG